MSTLYLPDDSLPVEATHMPEEWEETLELGDPAELKLNSSDQSHKDMPTPSRLVELTHPEMLLRRAAAARHVNRSPGHLSDKHRQTARQRSNNAMKLMYDHSSDCHYTQAVVSRWQAIHDGLRDKTKRSDHGYFPRESDCSSSQTWALAQGLWLFHVHDVVNWLEWTAGWTGSMVQHGIHGGQPHQWMLMDSLIWGPSTKATDHVTGCAGWSRKYKSHMIWNHGHEGVQLYRWTDMGMNLCAVRRSI